jgi:hypothetical protein
MGSDFHDPATELSDEDLRAMFTQPDEGRSRRIRMMSGWIR